MDYFFEKIIKKTFSLKSDVENIRIHVACDDRVEIYIDPTSTPLNSTNPGFIGTHIDYGSVGTYTIPYLTLGNHELIIKLTNDRASFYALIYGMEYELIKDPPEISVPDPRRTLCVESESGEFEVRALLSGRVNRSCLTMTFSQPDGLGSSLIFTTSPPTPNLNVESLGTGSGESQYSIYIRENALDFLRNLNGYSRFCDTVIVTIRAGNSACSRFSECSWTLIIDADNRRPEINFVSPIISPTTIYTFIEHSPVTTPPTYDLIPCTEADGCYCIPFPIPATFDIDILWASGLTSDAIMLEVVFEHQDPSPPHLITVQQLFDISRGGPLAYSLTEIPNGRRLTLNSSVISSALSPAIMLQAGDCLKFIFHFPDNPCVCPTGYHQQAFKLKLGCP